MKIKCSLNNLSDAIKQVDDYQKSLNDKCELFIRKLADIGINIAMTTLAFDGIGDAIRSADFGVEVDRDGNFIRGFVKATGVVTIDKNGNRFNNLFAWEFGVGNYYNGMGSPNPNAGKFGMGAGTYPNQTHVPDPGFWFYYPDGDKSGKAIMSRGTQATMPMYKASIEMIQQMRNVAKEVFA